MLDKLTSADFAACLHQTFRIYYGPAGEGERPQRETELIEVSELGQTPAEGGRQPFSLIFRDPGATGYLPQQIYTVEHAALGQIEMFLVPIGPDQVGMRYQAIFT